MVYNPYTGEYEDEEDPYGATREDGGGNGGGSYSPTTGPTGSDYYPPTQAAPSGGAGSSGYYDYGDDGEGDDGYDPSGDEESQNDGGNGNDPTYGDYGNPSDPTFHSTGTGDMPTDPFAGLPGYPSTPRPTRGSTGDTGDPFGENAPKTGSSSGTTSNNNTTNNSYNLSSTAVGSESLSNSLPPIASSTPAANPSDFTPQNIPQSAPRRMNPAGMDPSRNMGAFPGSAGANPYDDGLPAPSMSGTGIPSGNSRPIPTQPNPSMLQRGESALKGLTGLDVSSGKGLTDSLLGLTGVNRYRKLIHDVRKRPTTTPNPNNPYGI